jgi:allantoinase
MMTQYDPAGVGEWAIRGRAVFTSAGPRPAAILIRDEKIAAIVEPDEVPAACPIVDAGDRLVLPGLVETHAHINEPGRTDWEGFASATRAAAAGGITTLIDMPLNSSPVTTTVDALQRKRKAAAGQITVDCGFHAGIVPGNADQIEPLAVAGVCAFKAFLCHSGIDDFPNVSESDLRMAMPRLAAAGLPLLAHAELLAPLGPEIANRFASQPTSYAAYLATRPAAWEVAAIRLLIDLCREYRCHVHIVHLAAASAARELLARARAEGLPVTVETCPHYLNFAAEEVPDADPRFKCAPPIRERAERALLRQMVLSGEIDTLGSDHSPAPPELKHLDSGDLARAWGGIASLQLLLPILWTSVGSMERLVDALSNRPAQLAGLQGAKGALAPGRDADIVVFDPSAEFVVTADMLHHRHKPTPYLGRTLRGVVETVWLRGRKIFDHGVFPAGPIGQVLARPSRASS